MPEYFIVTVTDANGRFETDLEIPSRLPFSAFKDKLLEILKMMGGRAFQGWSDYRLCFRNSALRNGDTLADIGVFDGSLLSAERL
jgi:hypothetical protein